MPRANRDAASGNWASRVAESPYLGEDLVEASNPRLRAYALTCLSAFNKHWQFCCKAVSEKSTAIGAIAADSSTICEQWLECGTDVTSPPAASRHQPHKRWAPHRIMPFLLNMRVTLQKTSTQEKALRELPFLPKRFDNQGYFKSIQDGARTYFRLAGIQFVKFTCCSGIVAMPMWPDAPPSASAAVLCIPVAFSERTPAESLRDFRYTSSITPAESLRDFRYTSSITPAESLRDFRYRSSNNRQQYHSMRGR